MCLAVSGSVQSPITFLTLDIVLHTFGILFLPCLNRGPAKKVLHVILYLFLYLSNIFNVYKETPLISPHWLFNCKAF